VFEILSFVVNVCDIGGFYEDLLLVVEEDLVFFWFVIDYLFDVTFAEHNVLFTMIVSFALP